MRFTIGFIGLLFLWCGFHSAANAHTTSTAYLSLTQASADAPWQGRWDIALRDLELAVGIDQNADDQITGAELLAAQTRIEDYAYARLAFTRAQSACASHTWVREPMEMSRHLDNTYAVLRFRLSCEDTGDLQLHYRLLEGLDTSHRAILQLTTPSSRTTQIVRNTGAVVQLNNHTNSTANTHWHSFVSYVLQGIEHLLEGVDHLLFLFSLLLPAVLLRQGQRWQPAPHFNSAFGATVAVVTAFTISHSITLSLSILQIINPPTQWIESLIALSVVFAAANNIYPVVQRVWLMAGLFGFIHGFGFANVLNELQLPTSQLVTGLLGFNVGVELGQIACVIIVLPLLFGLRRWRYYPLAMQIGSGIIILLALWWFAQLIGYGA